MKFKEHYPGKKTLRRTEIKSETQATSQGKPRALSCRCSHQEDFLCQAVTGYHDGGRKLRKCMH